MATVEQKSTAAQNGGGAATIPVENPATGDTIAHVPDQSAAEVAALAKRARIAQTAWEALGFDAGRGCLARCPPWPCRNGNASAKRPAARTGKPRRARQSPSRFPFPTPP